MSLNSYGKKIGCNNKSVNEKILKECVQYLISKYLNEIDIISEIEPNIKLMTENNTETQRLSIIKNIEKINNKLEKALEGMLESIISKQEYITIKDKYSKQLEKLNDELNHIEGLINSNNSTYEKLMYNITQINNNFKNNIPDEFVLKELTEKIEIYKNNVFNVKLTINDYCYFLQYKKEGISIVKIYKHTST